MSGHLGKWCADKMVREWWFYTDFPLNFDSWLCKINSSNVCKFLYNIFYFLKAKIPTEHYQNNCKQSVRFRFHHNIDTEVFGVEAVKSNVKVMFSITVFACVKEIRFFACFNSLVTFEEFQKTRQCNQGYARNYASKLYQNALNVQPDTET